METMRITEVSVTVDGHKIGYVEDINSLRHSLAADMDEWGMNAPLVTSFSGKIKLAAGAMRRLAEVINPPMKDFHFWARVKLAQERRRLKRRRQGRS